MSEIESPCVKICVVDPQSGYCIGCGRTQDEIAGWIGLSADARTNVVTGLSGRLADMTRSRKRLGGAGARRRRIESRN